MTTTEDLTNRLGQLYDLDELAAFCGVDVESLAEMLVADGVPVLTIAGRRRVPQELTDRVLQFDRVELAREIQQNRDWLLAQQLGPQGQRRSDDEYVAAVEALGRSLLPGAPVREQ